MEIKKSYEADLENDKLSFTLVGILVAICTVFVALELSQKGLKVANTIDLINGEAIETDIDVPITEWNEELPPPPPPAAPEPQMIEPSTNVVANSNAQTITFVEPDPTSIVAPPPVESFAPPAVKSDPVDIDQIIYKVEKKAEYPGGMKALAAFLSANLQYPKPAMEMGIEGTVYVRFTVNRDGTVTDVEVVHEKDPYLDKEAIRVVRLMTGWIPAKNNSKNVRSKFQLPIKFSLH